MLKYSGISVNVSDTKINVSENGARTVSSRMSKKIIAAFAWRLPMEKPVHRGGCQ
jgi:hypothetical protein